MTSAQRRAVRLVSPPSLLYDGARLTEVHHVVAGPVEGPGVELQPDDGEDDDGEEEEESNVDQRTDSLGDRGDDNLETWGDRIGDIEKIINKRNSGS